MNKLATRARRASNDKGFSLIELVIVIAIMAALIAILAPQYIKYVERSRVSADETTANEILTAAQTVAADPDITLTTTFTVTWASTGTVTVTGDNDAVEAFGVAIGDPDLDTSGETTTLARKLSTHSGDTFDVTLPQPAL
jgi:type IV pilus assembly protein PilA